MSETSAPAPGAGATTPEAGTGTPEAGTDVQPFLTVVRGEPSPEDLAAMVAVLASLAGDPEPPARPRPAWADPARRLPVGPRPGPGGWRSSALPR